MTSATQQARLDRARKLIEQREEAIARLDEAANVLVDSLRKAEDLGDKLDRLLPDHSGLGTVRGPESGREFLPFPAGQTMRGSSRRSRFATFLQHKINRACGVEDFGNLIRGVILINSRAPAELAKIEKPVHQKLLALLEKKPG